MTLKKKSLIVGHGGREAALATRMADSSAVFAYMGHANPTICGLVERTGGASHLGDVCDGRDVARFASEHSVDLVMVSSDDPLAAGVVDHLRAAGISAVGPTRAGAEIEWNKVFCREVVEQVAPASNPRFVLARRVEEVRAAVERVATGAGRSGDRAVVVKPTGLAGGKGVKVVGPHLEDNEAAVAYATEVIATGRHGGAVLIEERIAAPEFTIQAMTDGRTVVFPPATYDYPYRFDGDTGPGTGGMGSCALPGGLLPFLDRATYDAACVIVQDVIDFLARSGREFSGCLNAGFFATDDGIKVIEFNARFGDPEGLNIMSLLEADWTDVMVALSTGTLAPGGIPLADEASVVTYLVAPAYAIAASDGLEFVLDGEAAGAAGAGVLFSAAVGRGGNRYATVGTSRAVAITARDRTLAAARATVERAITASLEGDLQWRTDIGVFPGGSPTADERVGR